MLSTEQRFLHSTVAAYGSQLGRTLVRLVADLALARLILPEGHGLFALAWPVVILAGLVRDLGLPYELVRDPRQPYGSVLVWELAVGTLATTALMLGAPLFAPLDPALPGVVRVLALYVLFDAVALVPKLYFERQLAVGRLVAPELARGVLLAAVSVTLAALGFGVWSFVAGELAGAALYALLLWWRAWGRIRLEPRIEVLPKMLRRSILLFLIALAANSTPFVGRFIVEAFDSTAMVGQYEKAYLWGLRLQILVVPAFVRVLYPALVEYEGDRERFVGAYRLGTVAILSLEVVAAYFLFFNAHTVLLDILVGKNWGPAVPLLRILCFVPLTDPFSRLGGEMLKVRHEDRLWLVVVVANLLCLVGFGLLLTRHLGTSGMAWANYLLLGNLLMAWRVHAICGREFWALAGDLALIYLVPLLPFLGAAALAPAGSWSRFGLSLLAAGLAGGVLFWRFHRPVRSFFEAPSRPRSAAGEP